MAKVSEKTLTNKRLRELLQVTNPFGVVKGDSYISYPTTLDAYVDVMMRIAEIAPEGYMDIPMIMHIVQGIALYRSIECLHKRPEIVRIPIDDVSVENTEAWIALLKTMLEVTGCEFSVNKFIPARVTFLQMWAQKKMQQKITKEIESYDNEKDNNGKNIASSEITKGDKE